MFSDEKYIEITSLARSKGINIREDSSLVRAYIENRLDETWTAADVVQELVWMNYLYTKTQYGSIVSERCREFTHKMQRVGLCEKMIRERIQTCIVPLAKIEALEKKIKN